MPPVHFHDVAGDLSRCQLCLKVPYNSCLALENLVIPRSHYHD